MGLVKWDQDSDNLVSDGYSTARGPVLRSEKQEVTKVTFKAGEGAERHSHPEEQTFYLLEGRLRVTLGDDEPSLPGLEQRGHNRHQLQERR